MHDFPFLDRDDRDEPVVIGHPGCENRAVHVVFEDHDAIILRAVHKKPIGGVKLYGFALSRKLIHQNGSPANCPGPTGKVVAEIKKGIIRNRVEEVLAVDEPGQSYQHNVKERIRGAKIAYWDLVMEL